MAKQEGRTRKIDKSESPRAQAQSRSAPGRKTRGRRRPGREAHSDAASEQQAGTERYRKPKGVTGGSAGQGSNKARTSNFTLDSLFSLCKQLRGKEGCPWDRSQTIASLTPYILEETHELIDAMAAKESAKLKEELGDVIFLLIFCMEIAQEQGLFTLADVVRSTDEKMKRRHPHVFGGKNLKKREEVLKQWEEIKLQEEPEQTSLLEGGSPTLTPLVASFRLQEKAAAVGFDWPKASDVIDKIKEELKELEVALSSGHEEDAKSEIGDLLFSLVNVARKTGVNPEICLRSTMEKFRRRFASIENALRKKGKNPTDSTLEEMDMLWNLAKEKEKS
jgi:tetrapyrrole methylase family protein/MazG family protein